MLDNKNVFLSLLQNKNSMTDYTVEYGLCEPDALEYLPLLFCRYFNVNAVYFINDLDTMSLNDHQITELAGQLGLPNTASNFYKNYIECRFNRRHLSTDDRHDRRPAVLVINYFPPQNVEDIFITTGRTLYAGFYHSCLLHGSCFRYSINGNHEVIDVIPHLFGKRIGAQRIYHIINRNPATRLCITFAHDCYDLRPGKHKYAIETCDHGRQVGSEIIDVNYSITCYYFNNHEVSKGRYVKSIITWLALLIGVNNCEAGIICQYYLPH
jgi:hypothetical protein